MTKFSKKDLKITFCIEFIAFLILGVLFYLSSYDTNRHMENHKKIDEEIAEVITNFGDNHFYIPDKSIAKFYFIDKNDHILKIKNVKNNSQENIDYNLTSNAITVSLINKNNIAVYLENGQIMYLHGYSPETPITNKKFIIEVLAEETNILFRSPISVDKENGKKIKNDFQILGFKAYRYYTLLLPVSILVFLLCSAVQIKMFLNIEKQKFLLEYGLNPEQIEFLKYLTSLNKDERLKVLSNIKFDSNNLEEFNNKLDFELTLFNKVYNEKSKFYKNIFDSNDFGNICFIINNQYDVTYKHKNQKDIIIEQQQNFDCLMDEIQKISPVQYEKALTISIDDFFGEKEMADIPFIEYTDLSDYINNNQKIINELKNIRFDCVFQ